MVRRERPEEKKNQVLETSSKRRGNIPKIERWLVVERAPTACYLGITLGINVMGMGVNGIEFCREKKSLYPNEHTMEFKPDSWSALTQFGKVEKIYKGLSLKIISQGLERWLSG